MNAEMQTPSGPGTGRTPMHYGHAAGAKEDAAGRIPPGLWLLPRKDEGNTARCELRGNRTAAPREVWRYGGGGAYRFVNAVTLEGARHFLAQVGGGLRLLDDQGQLVWSRPLLGLDCVIAAGDIGGAGALRILGSMGQAGLVLYDGATGQPLWSWTPPAGAYSVRFQTIESPRGLRLFLFPAFSTLGVCFDFRGAPDEPRVLWQHDYAGRYESGYGPNLVLADMDQDGAPELVIASKPAYAGVLDIDTGKVKFDLKYEVLDPLHFGRPDGPRIGRPYGLLHAADIDGDGFPDLIMVGTHVEEYIAVLRNERGRGLSPAWTLFVEKDFPEDHRRLVAKPTSLMDVNGDGRPELVLGLYNLTGDQRWRTVVFDPLTGHEAPLAVLPDRQFWGCYDVDGDGAPEIIVSPTGPGRFDLADTLEAVRGRDYTVIAALEAAQPSTRYTSISWMNRPLGRNVQYYGALDMPLFLDDGADSGLVVRRTRADDPEQVWQVRGHANRLEPLAADAFQLEWMLTVGADRLQGACREAPPALVGGVGDVPAAHSALVCSVHGRRELVLSLSDGTVIGGTPDLTRSGQFKESWRLRGTMPAIWMDPQGGRLVFVADPQTNLITVCRPDGQRGACPVEARIEPGLPFNRNHMLVGVYPRGEAGMIPFGGERWRLFVPLRLGENQLGGALYDHAGTLLWQDDEVGPMPRLAAVADLDGDGREEIVVDNHGMQYVYDLAGQRRMIAHNWGATIPGRGDGCAHAQPVIGRYGPDREWRIVMTPGFSAIETLDAAGERLALQSMEHYNAFSPRAGAVGRVEPPHTWALGVVSALGVFHCVDTETCRDRWTLDLHCPRSAPVGVCAADLDGDGGDEFLAGLPDGRLLAIADRGGQGVILWTVQLDAAVTDCIVADVRGDGQPVLIVETDDGYVRILTGD